MQNSRKPRGGLNRRDLVKGVTAAGLGLAAGGLSPSSVIAQSSLSKKGKQNLIQLENAKPGTRDWQLTKTRQTPRKINPNLANGRCPWIEGYCSANSIRAGETVEGYGQYESGLVVQAGDLPHRLLQRGWGTAHAHVRQSRWRCAARSLLPVKTMCTNVIGNRVWNSRFQRIG